MDLIQYNLMLFSVKRDTNLLLWIIDTNIIMS